MFCGKLLNDLPRWIVIALWLGANIGIFVEAYLRFETSIDYFYTRRILGPALAWARGSAAALNLNCMLILLPVCRNFISFLRSSFRRYGKFKYFPIIFCITRSLSLEQLDEACQQLVMVVTL
ncbi:NADPH oxidase 3-like [Mizuhopecten yessoensis]|uniref:NADPH oxidase 3-like n=1 Tax=Mizuhopecten yessoensis TaxID=6573 RepID=UPI000B458019|nr:NADPH oxidase 3-like [Mizuhopecten yessoensis]